MTSLPPAARHLMRLLNKLIRDEDTEQVVSEIKGDAALSVRREGDRVVLRLHLVEGSRPIDRELRYTFGFQATPVKRPEKDVWDYRIHHGGSYSLHTTAYHRAGRVTYPAAGHLRGDRGTFEAWICPLFDSDPTLPEAEKQKMGNRSIFTVSFPGDSNCGIYWNEVHQGPVVWVREAGEVRFYAGSGTAFSCITAPALAAPGRGRMRKNRAQWPSDFPKKKGAPKAP